MANSKFDSKSFNAEAFKYIVERVPNLKLNKILKSKAIVGNPDIRDAFSSQNGTGYARLAMRGLLDGQAINYDGETDITASSTKTFEQGVVVVGRGKAWQERDFSYDITGGVDFMQNIAEQVAEYWQEVDEGLILSVLKGIFSMTGTKNLEFVNGHTLDVRDTGTGMIGATTLNNAIQKASGDNKGKFALVFCHSQIATNLENLNLLTFLTQTDKDGLTREIGLGAWNGKLVVIDDDMPVENGYVESTSSVAGALKVVASSATSGQINLADVKAADYYPSGVAANDYVLPETRYITYVLGEGMLYFENIGAKVPYEMARDPKTKGGIDLLYSRQRKVFAPYGISYEKASQVSNSPENSELENGSNWTLVHSGESVAANRSYINHRAIAIARIISLG